MLGSTQGSRRGSNTELNTMFNTRLDTGLDTKATRCSELARQKMERPSVQPIQPNGRATHGYKVDEDRKCKTYPQTIASRRFGTPPLIPIAVSIFGVVSSTAVGSLEGVETSACLKGLPFFAEPTGPQSLCELGSLISIIESSHIVLSTHSHEVDIDGI